MDKRKALQPGEILPFPGMSCEIEKEVGRGSNAIVYRGFYADKLNENERHTVLIKELFPLDMTGGCYRDDGGNIVKDKNPEFWEDNLRSFSRGNEAHIRLINEHPDMMGENIQTFPCRGTQYTVLGYAGGRTLAEELVGSALSYLTDEAELFLLPGGILPGVPLRVLFPSWSGYSAEIRGGAKNADEWYGRIVHDLLWKRLGILARTESGGYQLPHEIILNYQADLGDEQARKMEAWHRRRAACAAAVLLCLACLTWLLVKPRTYNEELAKDVLTYGVNAYSTLGDQSNDFLTLAACAADTPEEYGDEWDTYRRRARTDTVIMQGMALDRLNRMLGVEEGQAADAETPDGVTGELEAVDAETKGGMTEEAGTNAGESAPFLSRLRKETVMPWSGKPIRADYYRELVCLPTTRATEYAQYAEKLTSLMETS